MGDNKLRKREEIPEQYKWKLEDMYATDELWEEEVKKVEALVEEIAAYDGKLADSAQMLLGFFTKNDEIAYYFARVYVYANQRLHQDTAVAKYQGYTATADSLMVKVDSVCSFASPEILNISEERLKQFYKDEPKLLHYKRKIDEILRQKEHTLSSKEESLLAEVGELSVSPENIFSMFNNADVKFPYITDVEGNKIQITHGNFTDMLMSKDRSLRKQVFRGVYDTYKKWSNTIGATYIAQLKSDRFYANARKYKNSREMYLQGANIPEAVYDNLLSTVEAHLPALHRYMELRKEVLGLEHLHMYDIYIPMVDDADRKYTYEDAKELVIKALEPMGEEYVSVLKEGLENGWIDVYENENKRSGAYSWGAYGTHPYVLLNHQDNLDSVFTLAHEMGHAMHTYFSDKNQGITYSEYKIFVAEVASTCNESLLMNYLLKNTEDKKMRLYLINHYLDGFRTTLFRQVQFAEFEHRAHMMLEEGELVDEEIQILPLWKCALFIVGGMIAIKFGGDFVVDSASAIALAFGFSQTLIGLTIVAMGTSLPELMTSIVAARKNEVDMALGNAVGSNIFNILMVLGIASAISPITLIRENIIDLCVLIVFTVCVWIFAATKKRIGKVEGFCMIAFYVAYAIYIIIR